MPDNDTTTEEIKEGDVIVYAKNDIGRKTAEGFTMRPGVPVEAGKDVTLEFAKQLVKSGMYRKDKTEEELAKEEEKAAKQAPKIEKAMAKEQKLAEESAESPASMLTTNDPTTGPSTQPSATATPSSIAAEKAAQKENKE